MDDFEKIALKIDNGCDEENATALKEAISEIDQLLLSSQNSDNPLLHYYRANAYSGLRLLDPHYNAFAWIQHETSEEILSLRNAYKSPIFKDLHAIRQCQILTNLGNALNRVGRPIDALSSWDEALKIQPRFAMAAGNRANGLSHFSAALYDPGHQCIFLDEAIKGFKNALQDEAIWDSDHAESIAEQFEAKLHDIEQYVQKACDLETFHPDDFSIGETPEEQEFNLWRLKNRLFINPLNDLNDWPVAAYDVFHLPSHTYDTYDDEPRFVRYFDHLKQEYAAACVLLWEGIVRDQELHIADRSTLAFETGDYQVSSIHLEKQKAALRLAYSLLDKCAVFINDYFQLGKKPEYVSFRNVWFSDRERTKLSKKIPEHNWRLRGLYSLSLDVYDDTLKEITSPLAVRVNDVRNAAEHRFLNIYEFMKPQTKFAACEHISTDELYQLSLHVIRLARSAIIGLSLSVHHHERFIKPEIEGIKFPFLSIPKRR
jgi:hypothetical protein